MKKIIFSIIFTAIILIFSTQRKGKSNMKTSETTLKVAFPYNKSAVHYEPTKIHLAPEYVFLENVYSTLFEIDPKTAKPKPGVASGFSWKNGRLEITLRENFKSSKGELVGAEDVAKSLKRVLVLASNTHGNFKDLLCSNEELKNIEDSCSGIKIVNSITIELIPEGGENDFLIPMLSAIDFAIIPQNAIDSSTLKISDYSNTTGPYYVSKDNSEGNIELSTNKAHYRYSKDIPQRVILVPSGLENTKTSVEQYSEGLVDHITTIDKLNAEKLFQLKESENSAELHSTMNIRTIGLFFTKRGFKELSKKQRLYIGAVIKKVAREHFLSFLGYESQDQFFPKFGDGSLEPNQLGEIKKIFEESQKTDLPEDLKFSIVRLGDSSAYINKLKVAFEKITVFDGKNVPIFTKYERYEDMPHMFLGGPDASFSEDIGLISYTVNAGIFGMKKDSRDNWLTEYMKTRESAKRMKKLQDLHFTALKEATVVPVASTPYVAILRNNWKSELPIVVGNNPFWLIKRR